MTEHPHRGIFSSLEFQEVACSTTEAEYHAIATAAAELNWVMNLLKELGININSTPIIYCDNVGATYLCANPVFHSRMKHIAIDFHFVREQVIKHQLRVSHVHTADQLADSLTKPLTRKSLLSHRSKIGVLDKSTILRGHDNNQDLP